jgi:hypothetical protein
VSFRILKKENQKQRNSYLCKGRDVPVLNEASKYENIWGEEEGKLQVFVTSALDGDKR